MTPGFNTLRGGLHPAHGLLLGFPVTLFTAAVATDLAYLKTAEAQWSNFSAWLISGGLVFGGLVGLWAIVDAVLAGRRGRGVTGAVAYLVLLAGMWTLGLVNAFKHSQDGWSSVGTMGLVLSLLTALLALAAGWIAHSKPRLTETA